VFVRLLACIGLYCAPLVCAETLVIAHRGASGYLPEHTLPAVAMAHAMGADYIEQDVVMTKDDELIVLHDITLDHTTDVAQRFPDRARKGGHFYAIDFTLAEIKQLRVGERRNEEGRAVFPDRFPSDPQILRIPTLAEEIELIQGLNRSTGRQAGIYVELKKPAFHAEAGKAFPGTVLQTLYQYGYRNAGHRAYLQCFDADTVKYLRAHTGLKLVYLMEDKNLTAERAKEIAEWADGVGPWIGYLVEAEEFVVAAQEAGLEVHPFTFRADRLPREFRNFDALLNHFITRMQVDGVFTDHPDRVRRFVDAR